jgi:HEAT repeat protein
MPGNGPGGSGDPGADALTGPGGIQQDPTSWSVWWGFNREPYLALKDHLYDQGSVTGTDFLRLGDGEVPQVRSVLRPTEAQVRGEVVPALLDAVATGTANDIVTGAMIALARIGDEPGEDGRSPFAEAFASQLPSPSQEISETAALALGILGGPGAVERLVALVRDDEVGRELVGRGRVTERTRAFAAYGLGLAAHGLKDDTERCAVLEVLAEQLRGDGGALADLQVACVNAWGLIPLDGIEEPTHWCASCMRLTRPSQVRFVLALLEDDEVGRLARGHVPVAVSRLLADRPDEALRAEAVEALLGELGSRKSVPNEVLQGCVLALGGLGDAGESELSTSIRDALIALPGRVADQQTRYFTSIALAQNASRLVPDGPPDGDPVARKELLKRSARGTGLTRHWAVLSLGILGRELRDRQVAPPSDVWNAVRSSLAEARSPEAIGACATAAGLIGSPEAEEPLLELLEESREDAARGHVAVALGLADARIAIAPIQELTRGSTYRPDLLRQSAVALGLLGDKQLVDELTVMLRSAKSLAAQASIAGALGRIGDRRAIEPLVAMLGDDELTDTARGFAAVALGLVADTEPLPWFVPLARDVNYRAAPWTLNDPGGAGLLNIL